MLADSPLAASARAGRMRSMNRSARRCEPASAASWRSRRSLIAFNADTTLQTKVARLHARSLQKAERELATRGNAARAAVH